ncbi:MAG TPA: pitrilysin family protein [Pyrinomonadaceae bacterium]|nr:pitrilysin family protein [Pyrinomonadaceae bacterium]
MKGTNLKRTLSVLGILAATVFMAALPLQAQQKSAPPPPGKARPVNLPKITEKKLANGLTVVMAPLANVPKITALLSIKAGQATGREKHPGIAQLAATVANEGTDTRSSKQLKEELRSMGGALGFNTNQDATVMSASALSEFSARLLDLMSDVVQHPAYPENEVALAKTNTIQSISAARADPNFLAGERFQKTIFGDHPYGFVLADEKSINAVTRADLKEFAATYYAPNNSILVVVGDFNPDKLFIEIEKAFNSWKSRQLPPEPALTAAPRAKRQIFFVNRPGSIQSTIYLGNVTIARKDKDYFAIRTADTIYGGSFYSRLTRNIREEKGYTYSPFSASTTLARSGYFLVGASVRNEVTGPTLKEIFYELDRMRSAPVTAEELDAAKAYSTGNFSVELASQSGLAGRINTVYLYDLPRDFITTFKPKIDALTAADIQKAATAYFDQSGFAVVIVGDYDKVKDQVGAYGDVTLYDAEGNVVPKTATR